MILSYTRLKNDFILACSKYLNDSNLFTLKNLYENELNSVRRLSYCNNLEKLIKLLEKADILNEENVLPLKQIAMNIIGESELRSILGYIEVFENQHSRERDPINLPNLESSVTFQRSNRDTSFNYNQLNSMHQQPRLIPNIPQNLTLNEPQLIPHVVSNIQSNDEVRNKCFGLLSQNLGTQWKFVGRYLNPTVRECDMDDISRRYINNMPSQILQMLYKYEEHPLYERRTLRTNLIEALRKARRMDLAKDVADVFDRYS